jgi:putative membrane protein
MKTLRWPIVLATIAGLAAAIWAMGRAGFANLAHSVADVGITGFLLFCAASLVLSLILGAAWWAAMPGQRPGRLPLFAWARIAREGANDLLPFSQIGGLIVGGRVLTAAGLPAARTYAAMVVDLTTELASQVAVTLFGVAALGSILIDSDRHHVGPAAWVGVGLSVAITGAFIGLQRPLLKLASGLAQKMLPDAPIDFGRLHAELRSIYAHKGAVALSFALNLAAWLFAALLAAMALELLGDPIAFWRIVALESLIFALRSAAFVIPGAIGVQEAGYVLLGPLVGLDPEAAVALSLVKRARDVAIGLPALLIWQGTEVGARRARKARA